MGLVVMGAILIIIAGILVLVSRSNKRNALAIATTDVTPVGQLQSLYDSVAATVGKGSFTQPAAVQGTIECDQPLTGELSNTACVAYKYTVERRWEEEYEERDSDGTLQRRTREGSDTVASNERRTPFQVRDESGAITVHPDGAHLDLEKVVDRFEPNTSGTTLRFGNFAFDLGNVVMTGGRRTTGYSYREEILPVGRHVYVLGAASDANGPLAIVKPSEKGQRFMVSLRTRDQVLQSARSSAMWTLYIAFGAGVLGIILVIAGIISRIAG